MDEKPFAVERAKTGRAGCKKCKQKIESGALRLARMQPNPFGGDGAPMMKAWHHPACLFAALAKARATTKKIEDPEEDIQGWDTLSKEDQQEILSHMEDMPVKSPKTPKTAKAKAPKSPEATKSQKKSPLKVGGQKGEGEAGSSEAGAKARGKDDLFREFRRVCGRIAEVPAYTDKSNIVREFFAKGSSGDGFTGTTILWVRMLLPMVEKRVYNVQSKQLVKLFSKILDVDLDDMLEDLEQGDVASTVKDFFEKSTKCGPCSKSTLFLQDIDSLLDELAAVRTEEEQTYIFKKIAKKCTSNDLQMIIRLIKHDLRINAGPKHILDGLHKEAYTAFQSSRDLKAVICQSTQANTPLDIGLNVMTPCLPMLAEVCKSVDQAMQRCQNGMLAEIKYDGERVQVHKTGDSFRYFSRSLKAVQDHKVKHFSKYIPQAFPHGRSLVLDSEVLLMDTITEKPLPFGTLGVHKKAEFEHASVCLFVFDCLFYNGQSLLDKPVRERREILMENMTEVPHRVVFSETKQIFKNSDLEKMIARVLSEGLEGLVLKDLEGKYEPGKRHWLKVKKDYLAGGKMADTADLVPLGAWFGTGNKGGMKSIFLMCCFDPKKKMWVTVTKVHGGFDDKQLEKLQTSLEMKKISKEHERIPSWLQCSRQHAPDFIAIDPEKMPVWEITGAEFTAHDAHTAGISVRFPRVTRVRDDKSFKESTNLQELKTLFENSRHGTDVSSLFGRESNYDSGSNTSSPVSKKSANSSKNNSPAPKQRKIEEFQPKKRQHSQDEPSTSSGSQGPKKLFMEKTDVAAVTARRPKKPLPDVFPGVSLVLPPWIKKNRAEISRYFTAYGGELLSPLKASKATHCLWDSTHPVLSKTKVTPVTVTWIVNSIRTQKLEPVGPYAPL